MAFSGLTAQCTAHSELTAMLVYADVTYERGRMMVCDVSALRWQNAPSSVAHSFSRTVCRLLSRLSCSYCML